MGLQEGQHRIGFAVATIVGERGFSVEARLGAQLLLLAHRKPLEGVDDFAGQVRLTRREVGRAPDDLPLKLHELGQAGQGRRPGAVFVAGAQVDRQGFIVRSAPLRPPRLNGAGHHRPDGGGGPLLQGRGLRRRSLEIVAPEDTAVVAVGQAGVDLQLFSLRPHRSPKAEGRISLWGSDRLDAASAQGIDQLVGHPRSDRSGRAITGGGVEGRDGDSWLAGRREEVTTCEPEAEPGQSQDERRHRDGEGCFQTPSPPLGSAPFGRRQGEHRQRFAHLVEPYASLRLQPVCERTADRALHIAGDQHRAGRSHLLDARRDIDPVAEQVPSARDGDVAQMNACAHRRIAGRGDLLGRGERAQGGRELQHETVTGRVEHPPAVCGGRLGDLLVERGDGLDRRLFVGLGAPRIAGHIDGHDAGELAGGSALSHDGRRRTSPPRACSRRAGSAQNRSQATSRSNASSRPVRCARRAS